MVCQSDGEMDGFDFGFRVFPECGDGLEYT